MILTCPVCATRYAVKDTALSGMGGRDVRCVKCGNVWHVDPEAATVRETVAELAAAADAPAETTAEIRPASPPPSPAAPPSSPPLPPPVIETLRAEPRFERPEPSPGPSPAPPRPREPLLDRDRERIEIPAAARRRFRITGFALGGLMLALLLIAIMARDTVMRTWPSAIPLYRSVRLADADGAGLQVTVSPARTPDSLVVNGKITNPTASAREIPRLRVALRDGGNAEIASQVIDPPQSSLAPGATAAFSTVFEHPSATATGVAVTFAAR
jgi:predicted Zn finger-like uncharacterized protein